MADAKQDKTKEKKDSSSEGTGFKIVMGGFDKNEVNLYISKLKRQMKEQQEELEKRIENLQTNLEDAHKEVSKAKSDKKSAEQAAATASAPIIKDSSAETKKLIDDLKAESDKKIMELRKSILDERRNVAKFDKECAMAKMSEKKLREEYDKLKTKYLDLKKRGGGSTPKAVTTSNADEVMKEAGNYASELIAEAKKYAESTVKAANQYKSDVEAELKEREKKLTEIKNKLDAQIKKTSDEQADSSKKLQEMGKKINDFTALFEAFTSQFGSVNSQITSVTGKIDSICKEFSQASGQIEEVAKQITETTSSIETVSKQINDTSAQINSFSKSINETTGKINDASKKMSGFSESLNSAQTEIAGITKLVDSTNTSVDTAKAEISDVKKATELQTSAADLSPIAKIGEEIALAAGTIKAELKLPEFNDSKFDISKFNALKDKLKIETTYEDSGESAADDEDEFNDSDILSTMEIDSPTADIPSDDDLMSDVPDVITAPIFEDGDMSSSPDLTPAPAPAQPKKSASPADKTDRPGLDSDFEDFFMTPPKDDDMSGDIPLINTEGVGAIDDFTLDSEPEPIGEDFDITPIDKTAKPEKGADLGDDIFDIAINPSGTDDNTLAEMMADASAAEKAANKDLKVQDLTGGDDFGEFADLFAAGSAQTTTERAKEKPAFRHKPSDDPWDFGGDTLSSGGDDSDLSADSDLADLFV